MQSFSVNSNMCASPWLESSISTDHEYRDQNYVLENVHHHKSEKFSHVQEIETRMFDQMKMRKYDNMHYKMDEYVEDDKLLQLINKHVQPYSIVDSVIKHTNDS